MILRMYDTTDLAWGRIFASRTDHTEDRKCIFWEFVSIRIKHVWLYMMATDKYVGKDMYYVKIQDHTEKTGGKEFSVEN